MTGLHTGHCRIRGNNRVLLKPQDLTIAEVLRDGGYRTGIIGKWGVGHPPPPGDPDHNGFDYFFGYLNMVHAHNYYPHYLMRNEDKVPLANIVPEPGKDSQGVATKKIQYSHDLFAEDALSFIERNKKRPFFLYLAFTIPHANNEAGRGGRNGMEVPNLGMYKDKNWPEPQKAHAAMITRMDRDIGKLINKLKQSAIDNNTIVFFSSDNGPHKEGGADPEFFNSSGGLRGYKRDLYEGGIRVPLIVRWPGRIKAGSQSGHISAFWDFFPTACELAGIKTQDGTDGISIFPALTGMPEKQEKHDYLYWEFHEHGGKQGIRMGNFKAVRLNTKNNPNGPVELYDLSCDPYEKNNIAEANPRTVRKILHIMENAGSRK
jgi:arylsulfatase A-like enzyme